MGINLSLPLGGSEIFCITLAARERGSGLEGESWEKESGHNTPTQRCSSPGQRERDLRRRTPLVVAAGSVYRFGGLRSNLFR
jgi:hypothetical protein